MMVMQLVGNWEDIVVSKARKEAESIVDEARSRASQIVEEAKSKAQRIVEEYRRKAHKDAELERQRRLGLAQLSINEKLLNVEHEVVRSIFDGLKEEVENYLKDRKNLESYLERIVKETFSSANFDKPRIYVHPEEKEIVSKLIGDMQAQIVEDESVRYGIVVEDVQRGFRIYNTLDTRMSMVQREILEKIRNYW